MIDYYNTEGKGTLVRVGNDQPPRVTTQGPLRNASRLVGRVAAQSNRLQNLFGQSRFAGIWIAARQFGYAKKVIAANSILRYLAVRLGPDSQGL